MRNFRSTLPDSMSQGALRVLLKNVLSRGCEGSFTLWL